MEIIEKSMKIGDKRVPRRAASHFNLRTTGRVGAVGGGRGREVYLLNLNSGSTRSEAKGLGGLIQINEKSMKIRER